jgi:hypothetical protein
MTFFLKKTCVFHLETITSFFKPFNSEIWDPYDFMEPLVPSELNKLALL